MTGSKESPRLLIVDDDRRFADRLAIAMAERGYRPEVAYDLKGGLGLAEAAAPDFALIDLRLEKASGLDLVRRLRARAPETRIVILTGYGNIATAVAAVKLGAVDYLAKPADADQIDAALKKSGRDAGAETLPELPETPMSADRVRWEHIQRVYEDCERNVSETARRLRMHRRTLQRIMAKYAPKS